MKLVRVFLAFFLSFPSRSVITYKYNTSVNNTILYFIYNKNSILSGRQHCIPQCSKDIYLYLSPAAAARTSHIRDETRRSIHTKFYKSDTRLPTIHEEIGTIEQSAKNVVFFKLHRSITSTQPPSFCITTFSASLTNLSPLLPVT